MFSKQKSWNLSFSYFFIIVKEHVCAKIGVIAMKDALKME
jgi:hypothetical protein